jgi:hypothetical protein
VFGRDTLLNIAFEADWQYIKERKQRRIVQNNCKENSKRIPHEYKPGDEEPTLIVVSCQCLLSLSVNVD